MDIAKIESLKDRLASIASDLRLMKDDCGGLHDYIEDAEDYVDYAVCELRSALHAYETAA